MDDLNLYAYVRNSPLSAVDPSGSECVNDVEANTTRCVTDDYDVTFATPQGFPGTDPAAANGHYYTIPVLSGAGLEETQDWIRENPTPGSPRAATQEGTVNDATPVVGGLSPLTVSPVASFVTTNQATGNEVVVNVTLPGHPLFPGIVVREAAEGPGGRTIIHNRGEGNGWLQSRDSPVRNQINSVWRSERPASQPACARSLRGCAP